MLTHIKWNRCFLIDRAIMYIIQAKDWYTALVERQGDYVSYCIGSNGFLHEIATHYHDCNSTQIGWNIPGLYMCNEGIYFLLKFNCEFEEWYG